MGSGTVAILIVLAAVAVAVFVIVRQQRSKAPEPERAKSSLPPQAKPRDIPLRKASEKINVEEVVLPPVPPPPAPQAKQGLSGATSRIWIVPDVPFPPSDKAQGFETGAGMTIFVLAANDKNEPLGGIPVRGIIDMTTGSALPTSPKTQPTGPDGTAAFRDVMRTEDQLEHGSKLIRAVMLDAGKTYTTNPAVLWDALTY